MTEKKKKKIDHDFGLADADATDRQTMQVMTRKDRPAAMRYYRRHAGYGTPSADLMTQIKALQAERALERRVTRATQVEKRALAQRLHKIQRAGKKGLSAKAARSKSKKGGKGQG